MILYASATSSGGGLKWIPCSHQHRGPSGYKGALIELENIASTHLFKVSQNVLPVPGRLISAAQLAPDIVIAGRAALEDLTVDGGAAADDTADADEEVPVVKLGAGERGDIVDCLAGTEAIPLCAGC